MHRTRFCRWQFGSIFIQIFLVGSVNVSFFPRVRIGRSWSSEVIDFGMHRKRVCDFLLVRHSNLGPIVTEILQVFCTPPLLHPNFGGVVDVGISSSINFKLIRVEIIFEVFRPMWSRYLNVTDGRSDRQPDCGITALCVHRVVKTWTQKLWIKTSIY